MGMSAQVEAGFSTSPWEAFAGENGQRRKSRVHSIAPTGTHNAARARRAQLSRRYKHDYIALKGDDMRIMVWDTLELGALLIFMMLNEMLLLIRWIAPSSDLNEDRGMVFVLFSCYLVQSACFALAAKVVFSVCLWNISVLKKGIPCALGRRRVETQGPKHKEKHGWVVSYKNKREHSFSTWISSFFGKNCHYAKQEQRGVVYELQIARIRHQHRLVPILAVSALLVDINSIITGYMRGFVAKLSYSYEEKECLIGISSQNVSDIASQLTVASCTGTLLWVQWCIIVLSSMVLCFKIALLRGAFTNRKKLSISQRKLSTLLEESLSCLDCVRNGRIPDTTITRIVELRRFLNQVSRSVEERRGDTGDAALLSFYLASKSSVPETLERLALWKGYRALRKLDNRHIHMEKGLFHMHSLRHFEKLSKVGSFVDNFSINSELFALIQYFEFRAECSLEKICRILTTEEIEELVEGVLERSRVLIDGLCSVSKTLLKPTLFVNGNIVGEYSSESIEHARKAINVIRKVASVFPVNYHVLIWEPSPFVKELLSEFQSDQVLTFLYKATDIHEWLGPGHIPKYLGGKAPRNRFCPKPSVVVLRRIMGIGDTACSLNYFRSVTCLEIRRVTQLRRILAYWLSKGASQKIKMQVEEEEYLVNRLDSVLQNENIPVNAYVLGKWKLECDRIVRNIHHRIDLKNLRLEKYLSSLMLLRILSITEGQILPAVKVVLESIYCRLPCFSNLDKLRRIIRKNNLTLNDLPRYEKLQKSYPIQPFLTIDNEKKVVVSLLWYQDGMRDSNVTYFKKCIEPVLEYLSIIVDDLSIHFRTNYRVLALFDLDSHKIEDLNSSKSKKNTEQKASFLEMTGLITAWTKQYPGLFCADAVALTSDVDLLANTFYVQNLGFWDLSLPSTAQAFSEKLCDISLLPQCFHGQGDDTREKLEVIRGKSFSNLSYSEMFNRLVELASKPDPTLGTKADYLHGPDMASTLNGTMTPKFSTRIAATSARIISGLGGFSKKKTTGSESGSATLESGA